MDTNEDFTPYAWAELTQRWEREEITLEQLGGQLLVWSAQLHEMLVFCRRAQEGMDRSLAALEERLQGVEAQLRA